jgi:hypothetical protein
MEAQASVERTLSEPLVHACSLASGETLTLRDSGSAGC